MADCQACGATACSACVLCVGSVCSVLEARHTERLRHIDAGEARARTSCSVIASRRTPQNCGQCICLEARHPAQRVRALVPQCPSAGPCFLSFMPLQRATSESIFAEIFCDFDTTPQQQEYLQSCSPYVVQVLQEFRLVKGGVPQAPSSCSFAEL